MGMLSAPDENHAGVPPSIFPASIAADIPQDNKQVVNSSCGYSGTPVRIANSVFPTGYRIQTGGKG